MHFSTIAATVIALLASPTQAECYTTGERWAEQRVDAYWVVQGMCTPQYVGGYFAPDQKKYQCIDLADGKKGEFEVQWRGQGSQVLSDGDCVAGLLNEVNGCDLGGESVHFGWFFRSDPNSGNC
ncbi:hypothetical protein MCOR25_003502 [Pyricularia grisea]|nr:hypothetical protein MCOR25_003502 [Pyricularia grisea]